MQESVLEDRFGIVQYTTFAPVVAVSFDQRLPLEVFSRFFSSPGQLFDLVRPERLLLRLPCHVGGCSQQRLVATRRDSRKSS